MEAAPKTIGKYQIANHIASGAYGDVFLAQLEGLGGFKRVFALRTLRADLVPNEAFRGTLEAEIRVAGLLSHGNIVQVLDLGQQGDTPFVVMEFVDGVDLEAVIGRARDKGVQIPVPHAVHIVMEVLKALEYAHDREVMREGEMVQLGIVHEEVAPSRVLAGFQGEVKLTGFGLARALSGAAETVGLGRSIRYHSPEQLQEQPADRRSDLFSVAVMLYEMLSGVHPFVGDTDADTRRAIVGGEVKPLTEVAHDVPGDLAALIHQALEVDPEARFPSATEFKAALSGFFHDAQFIFSNATLAEYLDALFPNRDAPLDQGSSVPDEWEDGKPAVVAPPPTPYGRMPVAEAAVAGEDEWDTQKTVVKRDAAFIRRAREVSMPMASSPEPVPVVSPPTPPPGQMPPWVAAGVAGAIMLLVGFLFGVSVAIGLLQGSEGAWAVRSPVLRVQARPDVVVRVDGDVVEGEVELSAGEPHQVELAVPAQEGRTAIIETFTVKLQAGEYRVLTLSRVASELATPAGEAP